MSEKQRNIWKNIEYTELEISGINTRCSNKVYVFFYVAGAFIVWTQTASDTVLDHQPIIILLAQQYDNIHCDLFHRPFN